jgi:penicillin-binding protein 1A
MKRLLRFFMALTALGLLFALVGVGVVGGVFWHYGKDLPDYQQLADYEPPTVTRVHAGDGRLLAEFAREKRVFVPFDAIPKNVVKAFLSAEDKNFYAHPGIDFLGVARAIVTNLSRLGTNQRPVGASTITQQVAKNFLLTNEVSYERKIKEAILAISAFTRNTSKVPVLLKPLTSRLSKLVPNNLAACALVLAEVTPCE